MVPPQWRKVNDTLAVPYETLARMEEHLAKGNGLKLDGLSYRLGRRLVVDAGSESIVGDVQAGKLLTRDYRKPFVVPDKV